MRSSACGRPNDSLLELRKLRSKELRISKDTHYAIVLSKLKSLFEWDEDEYWKFLQMCAVYCVNHPDAAVEEFLDHCKCRFGLSELFNMDKNEIIRLIVATGSSVLKGLNSPIIPVLIDSTDEELPLRTWAIIKPTNIMSQEANWLMQPIKSAMNVVAPEFLGTSWVLDYQSWYVMSTTKSRDWFKESPVLEKLKSKITTKIVGESQSSVAEAAKEYKAEQDRKRELKAEQKLRKIETAVRKVQKEELTKTEKEWVERENSFIEKENNYSSWSESEQKERKRLRDLWTEEKEWNDRLTEERRDNLKGYTNEHESWRRPHDETIVITRKMRSDIKPLGLFYLLILTVFIGISMACSHSGVVYQANGRTYHYPPAILEREVVNGICASPVKIWGCVDFKGRPNSFCHVQCRNLSEETAKCQFHHFTVGSFEGECYCANYTVCRTEDANFRGLTVNSWNEKGTTICTDILPDVIPTQSEMPQLRQLKEIRDTVKRLEDNGESCVVYFSLDDRSVVMKSASRCLVQVRLEKETWFEERDIYCPTTTTFFLPERTLKISGQLKVLAVLPNGKLVRTSFQIDSSSFCFKDMCFFCSETFNRIDCGGYLRAFALFLIITILFSLFILISYNMFILTKCCFNCVWTTSKIGYFLGKKVTRSDVLRGAREKVRNLTKTESEDEERPRPVTHDLLSLLSRGGKVTMKTPATMIIMCLLIAVPLGESCDGSALIITAQSESCIVSGIDTETCEAYFEIDSIMTFKGAQSCFTLVSENNHTYVSGKITFIETNSTISLETLYVTSFWTAQSQSRHRCRDAGPCDPGSCHRCCSDKSADGQLSDPVVINFPGRSRCRSSCGCATCGCFLCEDSCVYSGFGIIPVANKYYVKTSNGQEWVPTIHFEITDADGTRETIVSGDGTVVTSETLEFDVQLLQKPIASAFPPDGRKLVVESNTGWTYAEFASQVNAPQRGNIGDIQANTIQDLESPTVTSFIFDESIYTITEQEKLDSYTYETSGLVTNGLKNRLPRVLSGDIWDSDGSTLRSSLSNPGPIRAVIKAPGTGFTFVRKLSLVCPEAHVIDAQGCYSCLSGSHAVLAADSSCGEGLAFVSTDDPSILISSPSVTLSATETNITVHFETEVKENEFHLILTGNGGNTTVLVRFTADYDPIVRNDSTFTNDTGGSNSGDGDSGGIPDIWGAVEDFFKKVFDFDSSWWEYLVLALVLVALFVVFIVVIWFTWPLIMKLIFNCFLMSKSIKSKIMIKKSGKKL